MLEQIAADSAISDKRIAVQPKRHSNPLVHAFKVGIGVIARREPAIRPAALVRFSVGFFGKLDVVDPVLYADCARQPLAGRTFDY